MKTATRPVTVTSLAELIRAMREAQKHYLRSRSGEALARVRALEQQVDETLQRILSGRAQPADLFREEGPDAR